METPMLQFAGCYLYARDAVCCDVVGARESEIRKLVPAEGDSRNAEASEFWQVVGLLECGRLDEAYTRIRGFRPDDPRMLLALYLGANVIQHVRASDREDRKRARAIAIYLAPKTEMLRKQIVEEFKSELLEIRKGRIESLPPEFDHGDNLHSA
jgi:hypothetical protein